MPNFRVPHLTLSVIALQSEDVMLASPPEDLARIAADLNLTVVGI